MITGDIFLKVIIVNIEVLFRIFFAYLFVKGNKIIYFQLEP